jgi:16S rRNA (guanine966-N2)-methyltransferase
VTRIVGGSRGGRRIETPPGRDTRPTSDRVREALFSALAAMTKLAGCRFLDLYAGSGAVGLEAASRDAASVLLVESRPRAVQAIRANIAGLGLSAVCQVSAARVETVLADGPDGATGRTVPAGRPGSAAGPAGPFDVVFADPPYRAGEAEVGRLLTGLTRSGWLAPDCVLVVERSSRSPRPGFPAEITSVRDRRYGESVLWYGRHAGERGLIG